MTIHLVRNAVPTPASLLAGLPAEEHAAIGAIRHPRVQGERAASAWLRRHLLAEVLGHAPEQLSFTQGEHGKPALSPPAVQFNLSHTGHWLALAIAPAAVGIDIESRRRPRNWAALAGQILTTDELAHWQSLPPAQQTDTLIRIWTLKEAWLKGLGTGLAGGLQRTRFLLSREALSPDQTIRGQRDGLPADHGWQFGLAEPVAELSLAWAVAAPQAMPLRQWLLVLVDGRPTLQAQAAS